MVTTRRGFFGVLLGAAAALAARVWRVREKPPVSSEVLDLDFSRAACVDPAQFTRALNGFYYDEDGMLREIPPNAPRRGDWDTRCGYPDPASSHLGLFVSDKGTWVPMLDGKARKLRPGYDVRTGFTTDANGRGCMVNVPRPEVLDEGGGSHGYTVSAWSWASV